MNPSVSASIGLLGVLLLIAIWLDGVRAALLDLTPGMARKLPDEEADTLRTWLLRRKEFGFVIRALSYFAAAAWMLVSFNVTILNPVLPLLDWAQNLIFVLLLMIYLLVKEGIGSNLVAAYHRQLLRFSMPAIGVARILFKPYLALVRPAAHARQLEDLAETSEHKTSAEDEILSLVETIPGNGPSTLEVGERRMIKAVFHLGDSPVVQAMTPRTRVAALKAEMSAEEARDFLGANGYSRVPVYRNNLDQICGVLHARDLLLPEKLVGRSAADLARPPLFVDEGMSLSRLLDFFRRRRGHLAVVRDEYGGTAGIITFEDVVEELVGEVRDEFDDEEDLLLRTEESGTLLLDPRAPISDINEALGEYPFRLPEDCSNIGSFVGMISGRIPIKGSRLNAAPGLEIEIVEADERAVRRLRLHRVPITAPETPQGNPT